MLGISPLMLAMEPPPRSTSKEPLEWKFRVFRADFKTRELREIQPLFAFRFYFEDWSFANHGFDFLLPFLLQRFVELFR